ARRSERLLGKTPPPNLPLFRGRSISVAHHNLPKRDRSLPLNRGRIGGAASTRHHPPRKTRTIPHHEMARRLPRALTGVCWAKQHEEQRMLKFDESARIIASESRFVSGGVNSNFRLGMGPGPLVFTHGEGAYLHDVDGNKLIDYYCGMGATVLGHSPKGVQQAVKDQVEKGILFAGQSPIEYEAARIICERIPSAERLRFGSSGSDVAQAAMRIARASSGRRTIVKFEGHYHGWFDNILWSTAPALADAGPAEDPALVGGSKGQSQTDGEGLDVLQW